MTLRETVSLLVLGGLLTAGAAQADVGRPEEAHSEDAAATESYEQFLADRPSVAALLATRDSLRLWIARELAGTTTGLVTVWDPAEPVSGRKAEHDYVAQPGAVVFRVSERQSTWDQVAGMVFELHNAMGHETFEEIHQRALRGEINKSQFVQQVLEQEFVALRKTQVFLARHLSGESPRVRENRLISRLLNASPSLDEHMRGLARADFIKFYEELYDQEYGSKATRSQN